MNAAAKTVAPMAGSKIREVEAPRSVLVQLLDCVIPAWSAGIQADMDVSGRILRSWMPAIHAGMTKISIFMFCE
jgi:hypothetical protein